MRQPLLNDAQWKCFPRFYTRFWPFLSKKLQSAYQGYLFGVYNRSVLEMQGDATMSKPLQVHILSVEGIVTRAYHL